MVLKTKDGKHNAETTGQEIVGNFGRNGFEFEHGGFNKETNLNWFLTGNHYKDSGWRDSSPTEVRQIFGKVGWEGERTEVKFTTAYADNQLYGRRRSKRQTEKLIATLKMTTLKAFKYRIYPSKQQEVLLNKTFSCVRVVWNHNVEVFNKYDKNLAEQAQSLTSTQLKQKFEWMSEVSAAALQQKEMDFKSFKKNYFSKTRKKKIGRPSFKNRDSRQSYWLPNQKFTLNQNSI